MFDLKRIASYCEKHSTPPKEILLQLERETNLKTLSPQMLSGPLQGQLLSMISRWVSPKAVLEIGTFTGYGTICLASGLRKNGVIHTIEVNPELSAISRKYFGMAGILHQVKHHIGDAAQLIPVIDEQFDMVYIDAGKQDYSLHYDLTIDKVSQGGVILVDNVLWSGKVGSGIDDNDTRVMEAFNRKISEDNRVENLLLPIRDGLMIAIKNSFL